MSAGARPRTAAEGARDRSGPSSHDDRDLRVDFFRGLSLLFVFLIHTRSSLLLWFTTCNLGFSDPAEGFVFLSGYTAGLVYGAVLRRADWPAAGRRSIRQAVRIYGGHLLMSAAVLGLAAIASRLASAEQLAREMHIDALLQAPGAILLSVLRLQFRPANLDVLPLFVVLFLTFPAVLGLLDRWPAATLAASGGLYWAAHVWRINLAGTPGTVWFFNPFAWQCLFCLGAYWGLGRRRPHWLRVARGPLTLIASLVLAWSALVTLRWHFPAVPDVVPAWLGPHLYPISKTDLDPARLIHFLALAYLVGIRWPVPQWILTARLAQPVIRCGQHSLTIFGWGVLLSAAAEIVMEKFPSASLLVPLGIGFVGILAQCGVAALLSRVQRARRPASGLFSAKGTRDLNSPVRHASDLEPGRDHEARSPRLAA